MSDLVLDSLEIRNFRAFRHLRIEHLGRVNLVVGKNNVGKSCLLEAVWLYAHRGDPAVVWDVLGARDESKPSQLQHHETVEERLSAIRFLFHGRQDVQEHPDYALIGPMDAGERSIRIDVAWLPSTEDDDGIQRVAQAPFDTFDIINSSVPYLRARYGEGVNSRVVGSHPFTLDLRYVSTTGTGRVKIKNIHSVLLPAQGLTKTQLGHFWDQIALTELEATVLESLQIVAPGTQRIGFVADKGSDLQRNPVIRLVGQEGPVPLRSLGEGMNRMFGLVLALVNAKDGLLLVDEVDTGVHYSVLPEMWRLIFEVAHRLNVQVFATTHSWDCIRAFQSAASANKEEEGLVIRLENEDGEVIPVLFDERKLNIATREQIEVR